MARRATHTSICIHSSFLFVNVNTRNDSCVSAATHIFDCFGVVLDNIYWTDKKPTPGVTRIHDPSPRSPFILIYIPTFPYLNLSPSLSHTLANSLAVLYMYDVCECYSITSNDTHIWDIICLPTLKECSEKNLSTTQPYMTVSRLCCIHVNIQMYDDEKGLSGDSSLIYLFCTKSFQIAQSNFEFVCTFLGE